MKITLTTIILTSTLLINTGCIPSLTANGSLTPTAESNTTQEPSYIELKISRIINKIDEVINRKIDQKDAENEVKEKKFDLDIENKIEKI